MTDPTDPLEAAQLRSFIADHSYGAERVVLLASFDALVPATPRPAGVHIEQIVAAMADPLVGPMVDAMLERTPRPAGVEALTQGLRNERILLERTIRTLNERPPESAKSHIIRWSRAAIEDIDALFTALATPRPAGVDVERFVEEVVAYYKLYDHHDIWRESGARALGKWLGARAALTVSEEPVRE